MFIIGNPLPFLAGILEYFMGSLICIAIFLAGLSGWIWNIIKLVAIVDNSVTGILIARAIGVFVPPVGAVLGFL